MKVKFSLQTNQYIDNNKRTEQIFDMKDVDAIKDDLDILYPLLHARLDKWLNRYLEVWWEFVEE
jgi:hypothetical protein